MSVGIFIIAHDPLASALKTSVAHIYSATGDLRPEQIECFDVPSNVDVDEAVRTAKLALERMLESHPQGVLIFTDIVGATPSNIASRLLDNDDVRLISGVNLPAVISALNAPENAPAAQVMTIAEGAARAAVFSSSGREQSK